MVDTGVSEMPEERISVWLTREQAKALLAEDRGMDGDINRHAYWSDASHHPPNREQASAMVAAYTAIAEQLRELGHA